MTTYCVILSDDALFDIQDVISHIENLLYAPITAINFSRGIYDRVAKLENSADMYAISSYQDVLRYGDNARHIAYKGFIIIYTIHGHYVLVHRVVHGSLITK